MTAPSQDLVSALARALARAGVDADDPTRRRAGYSYDASLYRVPSLAVAFPREADDVAAAVTTWRDLGSRSRWRRAEAGRRSPGTPSALDSWSTSRAASTASIGRSRAVRPHRR